MVVQQKHNETWIESDFTDGFVSNERKKCKINRVIYGSSHSFLAQFIQQNKQHLTLWHLLSQLIVKSKSTGRTARRPVLIHSQSMWLCAILLHTCGSHTWKYATWLQLHEYRIKQSDTWSQYCSRTHTHTHNIGTITLLSHAQMKRSTSESEHTDAPVPQSYWREANVLAGL